MIIKLELPVDQVQLILKALDELPHRISRELIDEIKNQGQPQIDAMQPKMNGSETTHIPLADELKNG